MSRSSFTRSLFDRTVLTRSALVPEDAEDAFGDIVLTMPGSDLVPDTSLFLGGRRALPGGLAARSWFSFENVDGLHVVDYRHGGSEADPADFVAALATATRITVDLGAVDRTAIEQADLTIAALDGAGIVATRADAAVTIEQATNLTIGPASTQVDISLRGMRGLQRNGWGDPLFATNNQQGGTGGTGTQYLGQVGLGQTACRSIGMYMWGHTGYSPRLMLATGPAYSANPGLLTVLAESVVTAGIDDFRVVTWPAVEFAPGDHLWVVYREDDTPGAGPMFRDHAAVPQGSGDFGAGEVLIWDTTAAAGAANAFGATYTPTVDTTFTIWIAFGALVEFADGNGDFPADGSITLRVGEQSDNTSLGTRFDADSSIIDPETTHHRAIAPQITGLSAISVTRAGFTAIATGDDSRVCFYGPWLDLNYPATTAPDLLEDVGLMNLVPGLAGSAQSVALGTPLPVGLETLGPSAYVSLGFNYVRTDGAPNTGLNLDVYLDTNFTGPGTGTNCWLDRWNGGDPVADPWHDDIYQASDSAPEFNETEYRTTNTGMPHDSTAQTWPDPFITDASDDNPSAIAQDWWIGVRTGMVEGADVGGTAPANLQSISIAVSGEHLSSTIPVGHPFRTFRAPKTYATWIRNTVNPGSPYAAGAVLYCTMDSPNDFVIAQFMPTTGRLRLEFIQNATRHLAVEYDMPASLFDGNWHQITIAQQDVGFTPSVGTPLTPAIFEALWAVWIDGVPTTTFVTDHGSEIRGEAGPNTTWYMGSAPSMPTWVVGRLDNSMVFDYPVTGPMAARLWNGGVPNPDLTLFGRLNWWPYEGPLVGGDTVIDLDLNMDLEVAAGMDDTNLVLDTP